MGKEIIEGRELSENEPMKIKRDGLTKALPYAILLILILLVGFWGLWDDLSGGDFFTSDTAMQIYLALIGLIVAGIVLFLKSVWKSSRNEKNN